MPAIINGASYAQRDQGTFVTEKHKRILTAKNYDLTL